jgi:hypothetical protein
MVQREKASVCICVRTTRGEEGSVGNTAGRAGRIAHTIAKDLSRLFAYEITLLHVTETVDRHAVIIRLCAAGHHTMRSFLPGRHAGKVLAGSARLKCGKWKPPDAKRNYAGGRDSGYMLIVCAKEYMGSRLLLLGSWSGHDGSDFVMERLLSQDNNACLWNDTYAVGYYTAGGKNLG